MEKLSPISEAIANASNAGCPSNLGLPLFVLPGAVLDVARQTLPMRAATTEHGFDVSFIHS